MYIWSTTTLRNNLITINFFTQRFSSSTFARCATLGYVCNVHSRLSACGCSKPGAFTSGALANHICDLDTRCVLKLEVQDGWLNDGNTVVMDGIDLLLYIACANQMLSHCRKAQIMLARSLLVLDSPVSRIDYSTVNCVV
jgi:hypothetical protein